MASVELPKEGFVVQFTGDPTFEGRFWRVLRKEAFEYRTGDTSGTPEFSTVATNTSSGFQDIDVLEPDDRPPRAAYVEMGFKDGCRYTVKLKSGTIRYGPDGDKNSALLTNEISPYHDPDPTYGMWLIEDWFPSINAQNVTPFTVTPQVWFRGLKFDLEEIIDQPEKDRAKATGRYTILTLGGVTPS